MDGEKTDSYTIKVNLPGGIVSVGDFYEIIQAAEKAGIDTVRFGNRQQLYLQVSHEKLEDLEHHFFISDTEYEINTDEFPNIISSYVAEDIFDSSTWLREGVYKDILDTFNYKPRLKINLVDSTQTFVPFFTGNLNFISSDVSNYWYLYIRFPKTNQIYCWSSLVYSEDISSLSKQVESSVLLDSDLFYDQENMDGQLLETKVNSAGNFFLQPLSVPLKHPDFQLPYYEGFNKYNDKYWLGIYRRSELFSVAFLKDICTICMKTRIAQIYTTSWKSIIIKEVEATDRSLWNVTLGKHRINVRHASNELNWQSEDLCDYALNLKLELIKEFDKVDLRTFKLCFAIKINPKTGLFGSVIIRKHPANINPTELNTDQFDVLHTVDFNPNSKNFIPYKENISRDLLSKVLIELSYYYYQQASTDTNAGDTYFEEDTFITEEAQALVYQCTHCLSVYDESFGDAFNNIPPGTLFKDLDPTYCCPICEYGKAGFKSIDKTILT